MDRCYKTFVSIGNAKQDFSRLLNAIANQIHLFPQPILIQSGHTHFVSDKCDVVEFIDMDTFVECVKQAEILVLHAGAGSTLHSIRAGKIPILMPRRADFSEHVNDHQVAFAQMLDESGKAIIINDENDLITAINKIKNQSIQRQDTQSYSKVFNTIKTRLELILDKA